MTEAKDIIGKEIYINGKHFCDIFEDDIVSLRIKEKDDKKDLICRGKIKLLEKNYLIIDCSTDFNSGKEYIGYDSILYIYKEEDVDVKPIRLQEAESENI